MAVAAVVTVGPGEDMNYHSFTEALYSTMEDASKIVVYPGEYDIRVEYADLFGDEIPDEFKRGIYIHDRTVVFLPGSRLRCVWYREDGFSPIYIGGNVTLDGMELYAEGTQYAIHDDQWHRIEPYLNVYRYCRVEGRYLTCANCIGGGMAQNGRIVIDNCWFDNGVSNSVTVRYHNTNLENALGQVWVSDSYFNGHLAMCHYGTTAHMNVYVNGCRAEAIETKQELFDGKIENIDLYGWNNSTN